MLKDNWESSLTTSKKKSTCGLLWTKNLTGCLSITTWTGKTLLKTLENKKDPIYFMYTHYWSYCTLFLKPFIIFHHNGKTVQKQLFCINYYYFWSRCVYLQDKVWWCSRPHCRSKDTIMVRVNQSLIQIQDQDLSLHCI